MDAMITGPYMGMYDSFFLMDLAFGVWAATVSPWVLRFLEETVPMWRSSLSPTLPSVVSSSILVGLLSSSGFGAAALSVSFPVGAL